MMFGIALTGILSWVISGLERDGTSWITQPPLYLVLLSPFLFAAFLTIAISFIELRREEYVARGNLVGGSTAHPRLPIVRWQQVRITVRRIMLTAALVAVASTALDWGSQMLRMRAHFLAQAEENSAVVRCLDQGLTFPRDDPGHPDYRTWMPRLLYYQRLEAKYRHAAARPWIKVAPDPPDPW